MQYVKKLQGYAKLSTRLILVCIALLALCVNSCRSIPQTMQNQTQKRDSIITKTDSCYVYEKDSIYIDRGSDTIYVERVSMRYRDRLRCDTMIRSDTMIVSQLEMVEVEKEFNTLQKSLIGSGIVLWLICLIIITIFIYKIFRRVSKTA